VAFTGSLRRRLDVSRPLHAVFRNDQRMADFLVVLGIVVFALLGLGLIWALERV
jgi:hypothetical protein